MSQESNHSSTDEINIEDATEALRIMSSAHLRRPNLYDEDEPGELDISNPGYTAIAWSDVKKYNLGRRVKYQFTQKELFGEAGDEFDQLFMTQDIRQREQLADIFVVEKNMPVSAKFVNEFYTRGKINLTEPVTKMRTEPKEYMQLIKIVMEADKEEEEKKDKAKKNKNKAKHKPKPRRRIKKAQADDDEEAYVPEPPKYREEDDDDEIIDTRVRRKGYNLDGSKRAKFLHIDELDPNDKTHWSAARIKAFLQRGGNPNSYFYRFNEVGEMGRKGSWSKEEMTRFMTILSQRGANYCWGVFSKHIPGRVGYTCSSFYRKLMTKGWVWDMNYWHDTQCKKNCYDKNYKKPERDEMMRYNFVVLHDVTGTWKEFPGFHDLATEEFKEKFSTHPGVLAQVKKLKNLKFKDFDSKEPSPWQPPDEDYYLVDRFPVRRGQKKNKKMKPNTRKRKREEDEAGVVTPEKEAKKPKAKKRKTRRRKAKRTYDDDISDDEVFYCNFEEEEEEYEILLPNVADPVTGLEILRPSMSPWGHVMEHESWTKVLICTKACPFTFNIVSRRDLTRITKWNVDEYRDKVIPLRKEQIEHVNKVLQQGG